MANMDQHFDSKLIFLINEYATENSFKILQSNNVFASFINIYKFMYVLKLVLKVF